MVVARSIDRFVRVPQKWEDACAIAAKKGVGLLVLLTDVRCWSHMARDASLLEWGLGLTTEDIADSTLRHDFSWMSNIQRQWRLTYGCSPSTLARVLQCPVLCTLETTRAWTEETVASCHQFLGSGLFSPFNVVPCPTDIRDRLLRNVVRSNDRGLTTELCGVLHDMIGDVVTEEKKEGVAAASNLRLLPDVHHLGANGKGYHTCSCKRGMQSHDPACHCVCVTCQHAAFRACPCAALAGAKQNEKYDCQVFGLCPCRCPVCSDASKVGGTTYVKEPTAGATRVCLVCIASFSSRRWGYFCTEACFRSGITAHPLNVRKCDGCIAVIPKASVYGAVCKQCLDNAVTSKTTACNCGKAVSKKGAQYCSKKCAKADVSALTRECAFPECVKRTYLGWGRYCDKHSRKENRNEDAPC